MGFGWLKRYVPASLYARAALILLVPVVTLQLVVSVVFIQRHYEDVTEQMTTNLLHDIRLVLSVVEAAPDPEAARQAAGLIAETLDFDLAIPASGRSADTRLPWDLSGRIVIRTLREGLERVRSIDLGANIRRVPVLVETRHGPLLLTIPRDRVSASNPHQLLVLMVGTSLLITVIALLYLRNQLRPIKRLARAAEAFGRGRSEPLQPAGAVEVRAAGSAFLDMRNRIERHLEQRTLMLSGVSHDLRTPLTRLKLGLALIGGEEAEQLGCDVDEMEQLIDSFLAFASDAAQGELARVDPAALAAEVVDGARRSGQAVVLRANGGTGAVTLRPVAVKRALGNLVGNAVRYGTRVEVDVAVTDRAVRFTVEDDGPGIPPEARDVAVKPFTRLDQARNQDRGTGVGLGLAIAVDVARSHGGTLRLGQSDRLGGLRADLVLAR